MKLHTWTKMTILIEPSQIGTQWTSILSGLICDFCFVLLLQETTVTTQMNSYEWYSTYGISPLTTNTNGSNRSLKSRGSIPARSSNLSLNSLIFVKSEKNTWNDISLLKNKSKQQGQNIQRCLLWQLLAIPTTLECGYISSH